MALVALAGCGPIMSSQVADQINGMVGLSKEHVLSCMGPPTSTSSAGATEVWSYNSFGSINSSTVLGGNQSFVAASTSTTQDFCAINLTIQSDQVVAANYRSQGKLLAPSLPCYSALHACVPNTSAASDQRNQKAATTKEIMSKLKSCVLDLRNKPEYSPLQRHLMSFDVGHYTMAQLADQTKPTDPEIQLLIELHDETARCRDKALAELSPVAPAAAEILRQTISENNATLLLFVQHNLAWGDEEQREQKALDAMNEKLRHTPL
jgi:hypothetical protein